MFKYTEQPYLIAQKLSKKFRYLGSAKENETLKAEVVTLSEQPAAKSVKTEIKQVELNKKGRILQSIRNNK